MFFNSKNYLIAVIIIYCDQLHGLIHLLIMNILIKTNWFLFYVKLFHCNLVHQFSLIYTEWYIMEWKFYIETIKCWFFLLIISSIRKILGRHSLHQSGFCRQNGTTWNEYFILNTYCVLLKIQRIFSPNPQQQFWLIFTERIHYEMNLKD